MNVNDTLLAVAGVLGGGSGGGGGGGEAVLVNKTVTANGTYLPSADSADGYKKVVVNVPTPTLTTKTISENGTYAAADDSADGYSSVTVNVPTPTPTLITKTITENGTYSAADDSADGYSSVTVNVAASGGAQVIASGTYTGDYTTSATIPVGTKCPQTDFIMLMWLPNNTGFTQQNGVDRMVTSTIVCVNSTICFYDLSSDGTISPTYKMTVDITQDGATATRDVVALARNYAHARKGAIPDSATMRVVPKIIRSSSGFSINLELLTDGRYPVATFNWQLLYYGSSPATDIVEVI